MRPSGANASAGVIHLGEDDFAGRLRLPARLTGVGVQEVKFTPLVGNVGQGLAIGRESEDVRRPRGVDGGGVEPGHAVARGQIDQVDAFAELQDVTIRLPEPVRQSHAPAIGRQGPRIGAGQ